MDDIGADGKYSRQKAYNFILMIFQIAYGTSFYYLFLVIYLKWRNIRIKILTIIQVAITPIIPWRITRMTMGMEK